MWSPKEPVEGYVGFPEGMLDARPQRLPIWQDLAGAFVLAKPAGVLVQPDPWYSRLPSLTEAISQQALLGKPELQRLGVDPNGLRAVFPLPPSCEGVAVLTKRTDAVESLRNSYGSELWTLQFELLADSEPRDPSAVCDLPLARHWQHPQAIVSHESGKQTHTTFNRVARIGRYGLWLAETRYYRMDQLCVHGQEVGLRILGDDKYGRSRVPLLSDLKRDYSPGRREELPLWDGPVIRLKRITPPEDSGLRVIEPPPSKTWLRLLQVLGRYG